MDKEVALFSELEKWKESSRLFTKPSLTVLVTGLRGTGKSSLINSLIATEKCTVQHLNCEDACTLRCDRITHDTRGTLLHIWDTPGFAKEHETQNFTFLQHITKRDYDIIIYTIDMDQFHNNIDHDVKVMKLYTEYCGVEFWKNSIIALTKANKYVASKQEDKEKSGAIKTMTKWTEDLHELLESRVFVGKEIAHSVPVVPSGLFNESRLQIIPQGMSWINNVWLSILTAAKLASKPLIIKIIYQNIFKYHEKVCGDEIVSFIKKHHRIYRDKALASGVYHDPERKKIVGFACSFLHLQEGMLEYLPERSEAFRVSCCQSNEDSHLLNYWENICKSFNIIVLGNLGSGKTALINSLLYGKEFLPEGHSLKPGTTKVTEETLCHKHIPHIKCHMWDTPGLDNKEELQSIKEKYTQVNLSLFCISVADNNSTTEHNIRKLTNILGGAMWQNTIIVVTFANTIEPSENLEAKIEPLKTFIKSVFQSIAADISESIKIIPAGYHSDVHIPCDPNTFWGINLWMAAIGVAQNHAQPALTTFFNGHHALHQQWGMFSLSERWLSKVRLPKINLGRPVQIASYYKKELIELLHAILVDCKLKE